MAWPQQSPLAQISATLFLMQTHARKENIPALERSDCTTEPAQRARARAGPPQNGGSHTKPGAVSCPVPPGRAAGVEGAASAVQHQLCAPAVRMAAEPSPRRRATVQENKIYGIALCIAPSKRDKNSGRRRRPPPPRGAAWAAPSKPFKRAEPPSLLLRSGTVQ